MLVYCCIFVEAFILGSVPWGMIISRLGFHKDLRLFGSGNIGTTNAMRTLGKRAGILVFVLDSLKGYVAGLVALVLVAAFSGQMQFGEFVWTSITAAVAPAENAPAGACALLGCVLGHIFTPWLKFRGGKGIACAGGCLFILFGWAFGSAELVIFALVVLAGRQVSVGSLCAAAACPVIASVLFPNEPVVVVICLAVAVLVFWAHRSNLARLRAGTERTIGKH